MDKKLGSGGGGMPDSNVRWLVNQRAPLPKISNNSRSVLVRRYHSFFKQLTYQTHCLPTK